MKQETKKIIEEYVGKGKITVLGERKTKNGKWELSIDDEGNKESLIFNTLEETQEFSLVFGGVNRFTVNMFSELRNIEKWSEKYLSSLGYKTTSMTFCRGISKEKRTRVRTHELPSNCGSKYIDGTIKKKGTNKVVIKETEIDREETGQVTINFPEPKQMDNLIKHLKKTLSHIEFLVKKVVLRNEKTKVCTTWERKLVGDGTKEMTLRCSEVNGRKYDKIKYSVITENTENIVQSECQTLVIKVKKEVKKEVCGIMVGA